LLKLRKANTSNFFFYSRILIACFLLISINSHELNETDTGAGTYKPDPSNSFNFNNSNAKGDFETTKSKNLRTLFDPITALTAVTQGVGLFTNAWGGIVNAFKTTKNSTVKEKIAGVGFSQFEQSAQFQKTMGLKAQYLTKFLDHINERLEVPDKNKKDLKMVVEEIQWADDNQWQCFNVIFSTGKGGNVKMAAMIINHDEKNDKYNFIISDVQATFQLSDDMLIVTKSLSVAGGIFSDTKDVIQRIPRNITPDDVKAVLNFFTVISFKNIAENLGVKVDDPFKK